MADYNVVSKSEYLHPQNNNAVPADSFMFIRENGKKYLLIRFKNVRKSLLTGLNLEITQLDGRGKTLAEKSVKYGNLSGKAGKLYALPRMIEVEENCEDVKIKVCEALYGSYAYRIEGGEEKVGYISPSEKFDIENAVNQMRWENVSVSERTVKKRVLLGIFSCLLIVLMLVFTFLQLKKFEDGRAVFHYKGVEYTFENGDTGYGTDIYVTGFGARRSDIHIPAEIDGHTVTQISDGAFRFNTAIRSLTVEGDIPIGNNAFSGCTNLKTVNIENVRDIGISAFADCSALTSFKSVNLASVGNGAFKKCNSLVSVDISHDTQKVRLGGRVFSDCPSLASVNIAQTVVYPDDYSLFRGSDNVKELRLKNFENAVDGRSARTLVSLFGTAEGYGNKLKLETVVIENLEVIGDNFLKGAPVLNFKAENLLGTVVGNGAFDGTQLKNLELPLSVTEAGDYAFRDTLLESFDASELTVAGDNAFSGSALKSFNGRTLTNIGASAFADCSALESFTFGDGLSFMGASAFENCTSLTKAVYPRNLGFVPVRAFAGCTSLKNIGLTESSVITIGERAFAGCASLGELSLPQQLISLDEGAFENCKSLSSVSFPAISGMFEKIGGNAFNGCSSLKEIAVPDCVAEIGRGAFGGTSLEKISVPFIGGSRAENTYLGYIFGSARYTDAKAFPETLKCVQVTVDKNIPDYALYGCASLEEIIYPENVSAIGREAFRNCKSLKSITVPDSVSSIGFGAFANCDGITEYTAPFAGGSSSVNGFLGYVFGANSYVEIETALKNNRYIIPRTLEKVTLTDTVNLPSEAFGNCYFIKTVDLTPSYSLVSLGANCFYNCQYLKEVKLPANLKSIGARAFNNCIRLAEFTVPEGVEAFGAEAFIQCYKLYEIWNLSGIDSKVILQSAPNCLKVHGALGDGLEKLYADGFTIARSDKLFYLVGYPEGAVKLRLPSTDFNYIISNHLFYGDAELKNVYLPACVSTAGVSAFANCVSLEYAEFAESPAFTRISSNMFEGCASLKEIIIPEGVLAVGNGAFKDCKALSKAEFSSALTEIENNAFSGCSALKSIYLPESVRTVGAGAFENCASMTLAEFANGIEYIGDNAFAGCELLEAVKIPSSLTYLGGYAFANCTAVKTLEIEEGLLEIKEYTFYNNFSLTDVKLADSITSIGVFAFAGANIMYIDLPENLVRLDEYAFAGNILLRSVSVYSALEIINSGAFENCPRLYLIYNIGGLPLNAGSPYLGNIARNARVIADSFESAGYADVDGITYLRGNGYWRAVWCDENMSVIDLREFTCDNGETVTSFTVDSQAFAGNRNITSLNIGSAVSSLDGGAFSGCANLQNVLFEDGLLEALPDNAFTDCYSLQTVTVRNTALKTIGAYAFSGCSSLETLNLCKGLERIGDNAFLNCYNLGKVALPETLIGIGASAFFGCITIPEIAVPASVNEIGVYAFAYCNNLTDVKLSALDAIPEGLFAGCFGIVNISIPESVVTIGASAFENCSSVESVILPENLQSIGVNAFYGCTNLLVVYNLSEHIRVTEHGTDNGMAGYYAVAVFTALEQKADFVSAGDCNFVRVNGEWYLYGFTGDRYGIAYLPESFIYEGEEITSYTVKNYSFAYLYGSIVIPKAVKAIGSFAFFDGNYASFGVYYGGTAEEWKDIAPPNVTASTLYIYKDCVHNDYEWTYDGQGKVSVNKDVYPFNVIERVDPTCTETGYEVHKCSHCEYTYTTVLEASGHSQVIDYYKAPTCTEDGLTEGSHCGVCGETLKEQEVIPAEGHRYDEDGTCADCGAKRE